MLISARQGEKTIFDAEKVQPGRRNGLTVLLDQHSNQKSFGSVNQDNRGLQVFFILLPVAIADCPYCQVLVAEKSEFPLLRERGITLQPGEEHFLEVSGVAVSAR